MSNHRLNVSFLCLVAACGGSSQTAAPAPVSPTHSTTSADSAVASRVNAIADDYWATMMNPEVGAYARMVISYWDMAATMVVQGAIDADLFNETAGEHIMVFAKIQPILEELRARFQNPDALKNLEKVIMDMPDGAERVKKNQEFMKMIREQMAAAQGGKAEEAAA